MVSSSGESFSTGPLFGSTWLRGHQEPCELGLLHEHPDVVGVAAHDVLHRRLPDRLLLAPELKDEDRKGESDHDGLDDGGDYDEVGAVDQGSASEPDVFRPLLKR